MKLRFLAVGDILVPMRNPDGSAMRLSAGGVHRYVGRDLFGAVISAPDARELVRDLTPTRSQDPHEVDAGTNEAEYCAQRCRAGELLPADAETARAIGVELPKSAQKPSKGGE